MNVHIPIDETAEASVITGLLSEPEIFADLTELLDADDFGLLAHQEIWRAALSCDAAGRPIDPITVVDALRRNRRLKQAGGQENVERLAAQAGQTDNIMAHAQIVADKARLRRLLSVGRKIATEASSPDADADTVQENAETGIFSVTNQKTRSSMLDMAAAVPRMLEALAAAKNSELAGHSTGLAGLDRLTGGLRGGQLIILAARPAMGKSALAVQIARHISETTGAYVPLLSYEMSTPEILTRMLSTALEVNLLDLGSGRIPPGKERQTAIEAQKLAELSMLVDDNPPATVSGVRAAIRRLSRRGPIGAVVIDYLQLMSGDGKHAGENRNQEVSEISRGLKRLATELDIPIIGLSQLNRQTETRNGSRRPQLSDLRESGSLEQDANMVLFLYREHVYNAAADPTGGELIIAKQRNGPLGTVRLRFDGTCAKFSEDTRPFAPTAPVVNANRFSPF